MKRSGLLLIDKPCGPSSFDIIRTLRKTLQTRKMGHAGTLDPQASGLLVIAVNEATKLLPYLDTDTKTYLFSVQFGRATTTDDREGEILKEGLPIPGEEELRNILPRFTGSIEQRPPLYSAIRIKGKRAYSRARDGESFEIPPRPVCIHSLSLHHYDFRRGIAEMEVTCASGTYVRSLARDIAQALHSAAYAASIRRTRAGSFFLKQAVSLQDVGPESFISPADPGGQFTLYKLSRAEEQRISHGNSIYAPSTTPDTTPLLLVTGRGNVPCALAFQQKEWIKPKKVFPHWV
ncbi:MAG: tRNA pseudouridine(55) synthase TruB [Fibrobacterota bacterium]